MWNKAENLKILKESNLLVPDFLVINYLDDYDKKISKLWKKNKYAVRSNMLVEDTQKNSFAGQFLTYINIEFCDIISSVEKVIKQARNYWLKENQISVIIQEYVEFEYSWIAFSRSPDWWREMIIEYHKWIWEDIVSWKVIPKRLCFYHNEKKYKKIEWISSVKKINDFINTIKKIETIFKYPQDIEWWIKNWEFHYLQSRNITSINNEQYEKILFLEGRIKNNKNYYYEKNEVTEIAQRPTNFTLSLLNKIYSKSWPISTFYKDKNISATNINSLIIIWNELYIDKEKELKSIIPSFSYLKKGKASFSTYKWLFKSFKNIILLNLISFDKDLLSNKLNKKLEKEYKNNSLELSINNLLIDYKLIFEINVFTAKVFKKLETVLKNKQFSLTEALELDLLGKKKSQINIVWLKWNSLDISDDSNFIHIKRKETSKKTIDVWHSMPEWKRKFLSKYIKEALFMQDLREKWRILTVKHISNIRELLLTLWSEYSLQNKKDIYFANIDEVYKKEVKKQTLEQRKIEYNKYNKYTSPQKIIDVYCENKKRKLIPVSNWIAKWIIVNKETLKNKIWNKILLVDILSPDLVEYFDEIVWIVSNTWWILSHLAILARERWIPVVSWFDNRGNKIKFWDLVIIDWSKDTIKSINKTKNE